MEVTDKPIVLTADKIVGDLELREDNDRANLVAQADELVEQIVAIDPKDLKRRDGQARAVRQLGGKVQEELRQQSALMKTPMAALMDDAEDGGDVAKDLLTLQSHVSEINPNRVDFNMSGMRRLLSKFPGFGTPLAKWFARYQRVDKVIEDIITSLKDGRGQLERDNLTLSDDQLRMRELTFDLKEYVVLGELLDERLTTAAEAMPAEEPKRQFMEEELLFPLRQRIIDLQQQQAVNQQGVLATEVIIRNNRQLILGVDRAMNVTVTALNTAATLQIALQRQKRVLEGVQAVNQTTNELIGQTAEKLKTQGTAIQKQATEAQLDLEVLKKAFQDVDDALNDLRQFRRDALPTMAQSIVEMDDLTGRMEDSIERMESGNAAAEDYLIVINQASGQRDG